MIKFRPSSLVKVQLADRTFSARVVDVDSDPRCDVMVVDLDDVDTAIMVARSAIVSVDVY